MERPIFHLGWEREALYRRKPNQTKQTNKQTNKKTKNTKKHHKKHAHTHTHTHTHTTNSRGATEGGLCPREKTYSSILGPIKIADNQKEWPPPPPPPLPPTWVVTAPTLRL